MTAKPTTPKTLKPCTCSLFEVGQYGPDGSAESYEGNGTGCDRQTKARFAQGHDAKLVGFLVRAELAGLEISQIEAGTRIAYAGAVKAAQTVSEALAAKAARMLDGAKKKAEEKAAKNTPPAEPTTPGAAETKPATTRRRRNTPKNA
ncbi:hypothetical protein [Actinoplanes sp. G11-F43]|uniref:hypothetical protein n=1 Tax=Actinoplanes sp. G11-F43 TaxID=3424130 RepID=UPI003D355AC8